ncbi:MAG: hypothetical protein L6R38_002794 [Xanthoria sp. 2 TBL-2021]|nr:MAG: hypothetical protein L6R38_002794 [Xanthoria sp. 2 TBL-2021]
MPCHTISQGNILELFDFVIPCIRCDIPTASGLFQRDCEVDTRQASNGQIPPLPAGWREDLANIESINQVHRRTIAPLLQQALVSPTAKLDISKLLKSSPSPSPPHPSTASIPSFTRSFPELSVKADPRVGKVSITPPTSCFPPLAFGTTSLHARRSTVTGPPPSLSIPASGIKRTASTSTQVSRHVSKKPRRQWSDTDSDKLLKLRGANTKWDEVARRHFPGWTPTACRLRYQNYLEKKYNWTDEKKSLAVLYECRKQEMWTQIAKALNLPWRAVEDMHWVIGQEDMVILAGDRLLHPDRSNGKQSPSGS